MDNYIVSARKYRPSTFKSVVGQGALITTLRNAISGNKLAHAYLFAGPRGVGKTTCARIFAKTINCLSPTEEHDACNKCESCVAFNEQRSYNIHELDAASNNGVDDIRSLIDQVRIPPQIGKYKVYIIDEVHMLSQAAFNSFLKTLEEPPAHAIFVLATTEKHKIIPTILSRCQVYDFNRISISDIVNHLIYVAEEENITVEPEALNVIAQKADGGMRDALSIFDQSVSYTAGNVTYSAVIEHLNVLDYEYFFKITNAILENDVVSCMLTLNDILNRGFEGQYFISGLTSHFRDILVCKDTATAALFEVGSSIRNKYIETAKHCSNDFLYKAIEISNECDLNYRLSKNKRLLIELTLIKLCQLSENPRKNIVEERIKIKPIEVSEKKETKPEEQKDSEKIEKAEKEIVKVEPEKRSDETPVEQAQKEDIPKTIKEETVTRKSTETKIAPTEELGLGISISSFNKKGDIVENKVEEDKKQYNNDFSNEKLLEAWEEYINGLKEEKLLKNAMSIYKPKKQSNNIIKIEVGNEINKNYFEENSLSIMDFLRKKLSNDYLVMEIEIVETKLTQKAMTSVDMFEELAKQNPALQKLTDEFGLELK